jgi:hypothetical protein
MTITLTRNTQNRNSSVKFPKKWTHSLQQATRGEHSSNYGAKWTMHLLLMTITLNQQQLKQEMFCEVHQKWTHSSQQHPSKVPQNVGPNELCIHVPQQQFSEHYSKHGTKWTMHSSTVTPSEHSSKCGTKWTTHCSAATSSETLLKSWDQMN